jgi:hypothetical protein
VHLYLVEHTPRTDEDDAVHPPTDLAGLAAIPGPVRWLQSFSPDLHDDRLFSLWEASSAAEIRAAMERFGFMTDREATILRVRPWGPEEVRAASE